MDTGTDTRRPAGGSEPRGTEAGSSPRERCLLREQQCMCEQAGRTPRWGWVPRRRALGRPRLVGSRPTWGSLSTWTERSPSGPHLSGLRSESSLLTVTAAMKISRWMNRTVCGKVANASPVSGAGVERSLEQLYKNRYSLYFFALCSEKEDHRTGCVCDILKD